jgi:hypothetical protein
LFSAAVYKPITVSSAAPAKPTVMSNNWSGEVADTASPYTQVSGSWVQPSIMPSQTRTFTDIWVGIGGRGTGQLI